MNELPVRTAKSHYGRDYCQTPSRPSIPFSPVSTGEGTQQPPPFESVTASLGLSIPSPCYVALPTNSSTFPTHAVPARHGDVTSYFDILPSQVASGSSNAGAIISPLVTVPTPGLMPRFVQSPQLVSPVTPSSGFERHQPSPTGAPYEAWYANGGVLPWHGNTSPDGQLLHWSANGGQPFSRTTLAASSNDNSVGMGGGDQTPPRPKNMESLRKRRHHASTTRNAKGPRKNDAKSGFDAESTKRARPDTQGTGPRDKGKRKDQLSRDQEQVMLKDVSSSTWKTHQPGLDGSYTKIEPTPPPTLHSVNESKSLPISKLVARTKHNQVEEQYRKRLTGQYENLLAALPATDDANYIRMVGNSPAEATTVHSHAHAQCISPLGCEPPPPPGGRGGKHGQARRVSKAEVLDRALVHIPFLERQVKANEVENERLQEKLKLFEEIAFHRYHRLVHKQMEEQSDVQLAVDGDGMSSVSSEGVGGLGHELLQIVVE